MWFVCFSVLLGLSVLTAWKFGPNVAAGGTSILALLVPIWVQIDFFGQPLDIRVASGIAALCVYCLHRQAKFRTPLVFVDFAAIALVTVHLLSDWYNDGFSLFVPLRAYGEWAVPYLLGRVAIQSWKDARALIPFALLVTAVLAANATIETISRTNLFETVFGIRTVEAAARGWHRLGLGRAWGPTSNPIYFGNLQLLLFPWTVFAAVNAHRGSGPRWWYFAPIASILGICCTISRAPILGLLVSLAIVAAIQVRRARPFLIGIAALSAVLLMVKHEAVLDALQRWSADVKFSKPIVVGEKQVEYTGTLHRLYLFKAYAPAMRRAGLLGFGTERTTGFPPRIPMGAMDAETLKRLWSIDNAYILLVFRFGYLGIAAFCAMLGGAAVTYGLLTRNQGLRHSMFAASMSGALIATMLVLVTVWMPHDFGFWLMWTIGAAAGLRSHT
jgi:hypothetical protein